MSKSVSSESNEGHNSRETSRKHGKDDEEKENEEGILEVPRAESLPISTTVPTVPAQVDEFMQTGNFKRLLAPFVHEQTLVTLSATDKEWKVVSEEIEEGFESGELMFTMGRI
ncbi:hypothetical protein TrLO_g10167 [Triparma laevis f. longispina]|uniref:Uncharacterized protein n=1 Tax=Triparma laevis f. longispina TaxID=1714387 RepID=A0A9W7CN57_9STRA|nr:hypothetical protein TrLO_g10167 [Triparma laevis f. longispina]